MGTRIAAPSSFRLVLLDRDQLGRRGPPDLRDLPVQRDRRVIPERQDLSAQPGRKGTSVLSGPPARKVILARLVRKARLVHKGLPVRKAPPVRKARQVPWDLLAQRDL